MSRNAVLIALILAVVLTGVTLFVVSKNAASPEPTGSLLIDLPASAVRKMEFRLPRKDTLTLTIDAVHGWELSATPAEGKPVHWPVNAGQVISALRQLASASGQITEESLPSDAPELTLTDASSQVWHLAVGPVLLGGQRLVQVTTPAGQSQVYRTDGLLFDALVDTGPMPWRDMSIFRDLASVSKLTLGSGDQTVTLMRAGSNWQLTEREALADASQVEALLTRLRGFQADRFEAGTSGETRLARIEVETTTREPGQAAVVTKQVLEIEGLADLNQESVRAVFHRSTQAVGQEPVVSAMQVCVLPRKKIDTLVTNWQAYISRKPGRTQARDVGVLVLERGENRIRLARSVGGWSMVRESAQVSDPLAIGDAMVVSAVLTTICNQEASWVIDASDAVDLVKDDRLAAGDLGVCSGTTRCGVVDREFAAESLR